MHHRHIASELPTLILEFILRLRNSLANVCLEGRHQQFPSVLGSGPLPAIGFVVQVNWPFSFSELDGRNSVTGGGVLFLRRQVGVCFPVAVGGDVFAPPSTTHAVASFQSPAYYVLGYPFGGFFQRRVELGVLFVGNWQAHSQRSRSRVAWGGY
jgi:hypothetical protein